MATSQLLLSHLLWNHVSPFLPLIQFPSLHPSHPPPPPPHFNFQGLFRGFESVDFPSPQFFLQVYLLIWLILALLWFRLWLIHFVLASLDFEWVDPPYFHFFILKLPPFYFRAHLMVSALPPASIPLELTLPPFYSHFQLVR